MKNQRFAISSDYIRSVKLIKVDGEFIKDRLHFGENFELVKNDIPIMNEEIVIRRIGFLSNQVFYKIPNKEEMYLVFGVRSKTLYFMFSIVAVLMLFMLFSLITIIRSTERIEYEARENFLKQAIDDFLKSDLPSEALTSQLPTLLAWWKEKKQESNLAQEIVIKNKSKIYLGEMASRMAHDILSPLSSIRLLMTKMQASDPDHIKWINESIKKIEMITSEVSAQTRKGIHEFDNLQKLTEEIDLNRILNKLIDQKKFEFSHKYEIKFNSLISYATVNNISLIDFERAISNLLNNAIEASQQRSTIEVYLNQVNSMWEIKIQDYGKGISPEHLLKIGKSGFSYGKENGTGIGLFFAKQFIENNGGSFSISSALGQGTTISILLKSH